MKMKEATFCPGSGFIERQQFLDTIQSIDLPTVKDRKKVSYYNVPCAFDIEVSSFYIEGQKQAAMYIWQFGILNWVTYGRTWEEFVAFLNELSDILKLSRYNRLLIYVHNLAYEWQFMRKLFTWDKVFLLEDRKPVYVSSGGFEFRCSLKLSSKSLAKVGEDLVKYKEHKHVGDLDYQQIRFSQTPLSKTEMGYCEADIRVLLAYIQEKIETDGAICKIPLTNTGYVRNACRKSCFKNYPRYMKFMHELTLTPEEYAQLKRGYAGGFTHACAKYVYEGRQKVCENVGSFDFISAYIESILLEYMPMSESRTIEKIKDWNEFNYYLQHYCCLFDITLYNVRPRVNYDHPLSVSKVILPKDKDERKRIMDGITQDNGRIVYADKITMTFTEKDWFVFLKFYNFGDDREKTPDYQIHQFRIYERGYIPKELARTVLDFYKKKTTLKGLAGEEVNYMIFKNMLNACYGMMVTDIVRDILEYDCKTNEYLEKRKPELKSAIEQYNNSKSRFLFYPWGVWVTAHNRYNLFTGILACGKDYVYSDTDSIKILNPEKHFDYIEAYNQSILRKIAKAAKHYGFDPEEFSPMNNKGERKTLGFWEYEGKYRRFKTLGAKRYLIERMEEDIKPGKNDRYSLTCAGVNKKLACEYLVENFATPFDGFNEKLCVPADYSGRLILTYMDSSCDGETYDYLGNWCHYHEESYIHMEPSDYNLTISDVYKDFLNFMFGIMEDSD